MLAQPGTGKSLATRQALQNAKKISGDDFDKFVKQASPTGSASYHMASGATTIH